MSQYNLVLTNAGIALQQRIEVGETLTFTRMALGDGTLVGEPEEQTDLINEKQTSSIASCAVVNESATIRADFSNDGLVEGYYMRELGLFAEDVDNPEEEVLYAYGNAGELADYMPPDTGGDVTTIIEKIVVGVGSVDVSAIISLEEVYVTQEQWGEHVGVGGSSQHPLATSSVDGFQSHTDKSAWDAHKGYGGIAQHPIVTQSLSGFMSHIDKAKLDNHEGQGGTSKHPLTTSSVAGFQDPAERTDWLAHKGAGGVAQHPLVTSNLSGFMSYPDKIKLDNHVGQGGSGAATHPLVTSSVDGFQSHTDKADWTAHKNARGTGIHLTATQSESGFMSAADKAKLDNHEGQGGTSKHPNATSSTSGFHSSSDKADWDSHKNAGGAVHALATQDAHGFMPKTDKAKLDNHIGQGGSGDATHPLVTSSVDGLQSHTDKAKFDLINPGWLTLVKYGVNLDDLTEWDAASHVGVNISRIISRYGELGFFSPFQPNSHTILLCQRITVDAATSVTIPVMKNDDRIWMGFKKTFGDQSLIDAGYLSGGVGYGRNLSASLPTAGEYLVYIVLNNSGGDRCAAAIGEWYNSHISWKSFE